MNPSSYPPLAAGLFEYAQDWKFTDGQGMPADLRPDQYIKVMYSGGVVSAYVRVAAAWEHWMAGRNWWLKPDDDRLYIIAYVVI